MMKHLINRLICFLFDHRWFDYGEQIDDHTLLIDWRCKRCGKEEMKIVDVNNYDEEDI